MKRRTFKRIRKGGNIFRYFFTPTENKNIRKRQYSEDNDEDELQKMDKINLDSRAASAAYDKKLIDRMHEDYNEIKNYRADTPEEKRKRSEDSNGKSSQSSLESLVIDFQKKYDKPMDPRFWKPKIIKESIALLEEIKRLNNNV